MFDIGFWELMTIALIALLVIGPEKLPLFARDTAQFLNKIRRLVQYAKRELEKELDVDETGKLKDSINDLDTLMQNAPDRMIMNKTQKDPND